MISWSLTSWVWYHLHCSAVFIQTLLGVLSFEPHILRLSFLFVSSEMYFIFNSEALASPNVLIQTVSVLTSKLYWHNLHHRLINFKIMVS